MSIVFSENRMEVIKAFAKCRSLVVNPKKNSVNPHLKNHYADLKAVSAAVDPALDICGLVLTAAIVYVEGQQPNQIAVETMIIHAESGEWMSSIGVLPVSKQDAQAATGGVTYLRRYAKMCIFDLMASDDDGNRTVKTAKDWERDVNSCNNETELRELFTKAQAAGVDSAMMTIIKDCSLTRKKELSVVNSKPFVPPAKVKKPETKVDTQEPAGGEPNFDQELPDNF